MEMDEKDLEKVAGGDCWTECLYKGECPGFCRFIS
ncbi:MAG: ComC/BlpC family leader-containing pheromone/bacteriocin [Spirochaetia bacterium]|nr:ComC/BlpC family leader-containing pheromone/bacteriocin [Spirochaetia bacterium]